MSTTDSIGLHYIAKLERWRKLDEPYRQYCVIRRNGREWEVQLVSTRGGLCRRVATHDTKPEATDAVLEDWDTNTARVGKRR